MDRAARAASIALLVVGAIAAISLIAWSIYVQQTTFGPGPGRPGLRTGLELAARLSTAYYLVLAATATGLLALAHAQWTQRRIAFLVGLVASVIAIAAVWCGQRFIVGLEDPHFVNKSPWVKAATFVATITTVYLAILALTSLVAWLVSRGPQTRGPR
jgi:hypothetical protein